MIEKEAAAANLQSPDLDPLIRKWLTGTPLIRLIKYGCEVVENERVFKVHYADHGTFIYKHIGTNGH